MLAPAVQGIDLFKIAGRSISGWIPSLKTGYPGQVRQPFCSHMEERLLLYLEYHPQVACYARGDIGAQFATTYRLPIPKDAPFAIGYVFDGNPHDYLPDVVGTLTTGKLLIAEAGMEDDKPQDRQQAKAEAAKTDSSESESFVTLFVTISRRRYANMTRRKAQKDCPACFQHRQERINDTICWISTNETALC